MPAEEAPGTGGLIYQSFSPPVINATGEIAFEALISGGVNDRGAWSGTPGNLDLDVRKGDGAPDATGAPLGFNFLRFSPFNTLDP